MLLLLNYYLLALSILIMQLLLLYFIWLEVNFYKVLVSNFFKHSHLNKFNLSNLSSPNLRLTVYLWTPIFSKWSYVNFCFKQNYSIN